MGTHYLKVKLYFERNDKYLGYHIIDGGYNDPESWIEIRTSRYKNGKKNRTFIYTVRDEGKPFQAYVEEALTAYHKWLDEGNQMWVTERNMKNDHCSWIITEIPGMEK